MRVAALYDIHGNLPALEAVLEELEEDVDRVVVGGDVFPGPLALECLLLLEDLDLPVSFLHGNGETAVLASRAGEHLDHLPPPAREAVRWCAERLSPEQARRIAEWPGMLRLDVPALGEVLFCHATPRNDTEIFTERTPEERLVPLFDRADAPLVVCGHTHMPFDRTIAETRVVNAGSVGMPFGPPGADWLVLGAEVEFRHTDYHLEQAAARVRATDYPGAGDFAERCVLDPPSAEAMLQRYGEGSLA